ncbi:hypothetical protein OG2516_02109 [Oceanicola granulosus HTCC2516]|uniref:SPOR domain-containing protein n=1 Tax=Oceanicola granulosus (strain ATCC BAA-861 / DSM 15982 / KCTC 12143 / HTCC2516) TaxID=314256 RepID=Q2CHV2_OCEGH|nr:SPOR domain-containing protein [Oceanicola granulosus]EAR52192.1 hypothetical protein OG2516_02109 [Oceanicola granulosus HTCC2516]
MADLSYGADAPQPAFAAGTLVNLAGAALSLALIAGVGVWGYKLVVRDVTGVPVVRAIEGPMRTAPDNPGGEVALHRGLAVNAVAAVGEAAPPEDRLMLAPGGVGLAAEDLEVPAEEAPAEAIAGVTAAVARAAGGEAQLIEASAPAADMAAAPGDDEAMTAEQIMQLADQIAAGIEPLTATDVENASVEMSLDGAPVAGPDAIDATVPGVSVSPRPPQRPMRIAGIQPTAAGLAPTNASLAAADVPAASGALRIAVPEAIPAGTKLVQLGAFDTEQLAAEEWLRMSSRFSDFMDGKSRVIQRAESGGRTFYRLRAMGFDDLSDARRFCAALVSEDALCIPVVMR